MLCPRMGHGLSKYTGSSFTVVLTGSGVPLLVGSCDNSLLGNLFADSMASVRLTSAAPLVRISLSILAATEGWCLLTAA